MPAHFSLAIIFLVVSPLKLWILIWICSSKLRATNVVRRKKLLVELGYSIHEAQRKRVVGFFHPYCNAGGGGELVLWTAIAATQQTHPDVISVVYTGDTDASKAQIIAKAKARFNITLDPTRLHFVFLKSRYLVEESTWPRFTLLGQSLGSICLALEAMLKLIPDLYIDSMGYAFTFPVVSLLGKIPVGAYVHYPTISTDMLARVRSRKQWHTNASKISTSVLLSQLKLLYYRVFMYHYSVALRTASFLMVNSTWTKNHVDSILHHSDLLIDVLYFIPPFALIKLFFTSVNGPGESQIVYPPCDTQEMEKFPLTPRERVILSVAQFRPEKDHKTQVMAFYQLLDKHPEYCNGTGVVKLVLVGGSRNEGDARRVEDLKSLVKALGIEAQVEFVVNASYASVLDWLSRASVGLSTMVDEHFGINIVEFMAAGVIPLTHKSGGPLMDIIVPFEGLPTGYHALSPEMFADAMHEILTLPPTQELSMRSNARKWAVKRFSKDEFTKGWEESGWKTFLYRRKSS